MLESLLRRPQRLLVLLAAFMVILLLSTYLSLSSWGSEQIRTQLKHIPAMFGNQTCPTGDLLAYSNGSSLPNLFMSNIKTVEDLRPYAVRGDDGNLYPPEFYPKDINKAPRAKAAFISLVRNEELEGMKSSMREGMYSKSNM
ncbi:hypothetical protein ACI68E_001686 [Malassezia pachydermatis]